MNKKLFNLNLNIDHRKKDSIHKQIIDQMKEIISHQSFNQVLELESIESISKQNHIDSKEIKQAFNDLIQEGYLIYTNQTYFINRIHLYQDFYGGIVSLYDAIKHTGYDVSMKVMDYKILSKSQQNKLNLNMFKQVLFVRKLYLANEMPIILLDAYYDAKYFDQPLNFDFEHNAIFKYLEDTHHIKMDNSKRLIEVITPPKDIQKILSNPLDSATICVKAHTYQGNELIEYGCGYASINYSIYLKTVIKP